MTTFRCLFDNPVLGDHSPLVLGWGEDQLRPIVDRLAPFLPDNLTVAMRLGDRGCRTVHRDRGEDHRQRGALRTRKRRLQHPEAIPRRRPPQHLALHHPRHGHLGERRTDPAGPRALVPERPWIPVGGLGDRCAGGPGGTAARRFGASPSDPAGGDDRAAQPARQGGRRLRGDRRHHRHARAGGSGERGPLPSRSTPVRQAHRDSHRAPNLQRLLRTWAVVSTATAPRSRTCAPVTVATWNA